METGLHEWTPDSGWQSHRILNHDQRDLQLMFGPRPLMKKSAWKRRSGSPLSNAVPLVGASSAGEIVGDNLRDGSLVLTDVSFEDTDVRVVSADLDRPSASIEAGTELGEKLASDRLTHVLVFSDGTSTNGSRLVEGLRGTLPSSVSLSGGLAGDGERFEKAPVLAQGSLTNLRAVAVGFYGSQLSVGCGSMGGWSRYGPTWEVTSSEGQILKALDGEPALSIYREYMGSRAEELPRSGLLFPFSVQFDREEKNSLVRTLLDINEDDGSIKLAGDVPEGATVQLMKADFQGLLEGARTAAQSAVESLGESVPDFALLVSCVGRKMLMNDRIVEEIRQVQDEYETQCPSAGFYSYGEISPHAVSNRTELHNQTMTITTFAES